MTQPGFPAQPGVNVASAMGDVNRVCPGCNRGQATGHDGDPRHVVLGGRVETQLATLANGQQVPVQTPVDVAYHFDCHAKMGCDHCQEMLDHHGGSVKGKAASGFSAPEHLIDITPGEFEIGPEGVLRRVADKKTAREALHAAEKAAGIEFVTEDKAFKIHERHAAQLRGEEV
jgi:hypothetical protein